MGAAVAVGALVVALAGCAPGEEPDQAGEAEPTGRAEPAPEPASGWTAHPYLDDTRAVAAAPDGGVWVGTSDAGLVRWHGDGRYEHHPLPEALAGEFVTSVAVAGDGAVWVAFHTAGPRAEADPGKPAVGRFDGGAWTSWTVGDGVAHHQVADLAVAADGAVWAATPAGLSRFDGGEWTTVTAEDGLPRDHVTSVGAGGDAVWAATESPDRGSETEVGLSRFDGGPRPSPGSSSPVQLVHASPGRASGRERVCRYV
jgi:hypothetical protein